MVSTRPSLSITTPPPARSWPSVSAERAVDGTVARTPTTAFRGLVLGAASDCAAAGRPARQTVARKPPIRAARERITTCRVLAGTETCRSEEHTSELQSLMRISYAVFCLKKKKHAKRLTTHTQHTRPRPTYTITNPHL